MKKIKGILVFTVIAMGVFFSTTSINSKKEDMDLASLMAVETADAKWAWFGCGQGGDQCGGNYNCKWVIVSSNACSPNPHPQQ
ncbi:hypothetical protein Lupro_11625 [Lutibacter profundi]|uniref:Uncharacterized protein n=1 Tax=Lutibacter profundi TaxID=1622118 RepID=A0A120IEJ6_9FLAO|nr:hypothetical protein [Lutibacter profundi]AMC11874.1 hypothetical protein Lupro_11625 [Lutibacter profundi]